MDMEVEKERQSGSGRIDLFSRRTQVLFPSDSSPSEPIERAEALRVSYKKSTEYAGLLGQKSSAFQRHPGLSDAVMETVDAESDDITGVSSRKERVLQRKKLGSFVESERESGSVGEKRLSVRVHGQHSSSGALIPISKQGLPGTVKPTWHAPWKRMKVISGHLGWVRCIAVDPSNEWFATGSNDRTIKIWDMASSVLKLTLTGHISNVMGLAISESRPYMFSVGEDKKAKCWDLEVNKVVRHYHGHMSGIYCCALHPTIDLFITGSRDSSVRVWDIRTKTPVHVLTGHNHTVASVLAQATEPQVISGSYDSTIRCWDLIAGKTMSVLTHHKKGIRALCLHPHEYTLLSGSRDNIKKWKMPEMDFLQNIGSQDEIVSCLSVNHEGVLFSGGLSGSMRFWDYRTGHCFQKDTTVVQPGSLESEAGICASAFDRTGTRLIVGEVDSSIKIYKEDELATEESHPLDWKPSLPTRKY